jgi:hypothetical protein
MSEHPGLQHSLALEREIRDFAVVKAISLTQPWATLVAIGAKRFETRSWLSHYRGWLAIHAAKSFPRDCQALCYQQPFAANLAHAGYNTPADLPRGQVLAVANLTDCLSTNHWQPASSVEYDFGNYGPHRFAWELASVQRLKTPFSANGALGLWKLPQPIHLADLVMARAKVLGTVRTRGAPDEALALQFLVPLLLQQLAPRANEHGDQDTAPGRDLPAIEQGSQRRLDRRTTTDTR